MRTVVFRPTFDHDAETAAGWYEEQRQGLGDEFLVELDRAVIRIRENPESFALMDDVVRVCRLQRFKYGIYFRATAVEVVITSVIHLHRDDSAWKSRT